MPAHDHSAERRQPAKRFTGDGLQAHDCEAGLDRRSVRLGQCEVVSEFVHVAFMPASMDNTNTWQVRPQRQGHEPVNDLLIQMQVAVWCRSAVH